MSAEVLLVTAPFLSVVRPALGVSTLKAALDAKGVSSRIEYLNLAFADRVGVEVSELIADALPTHLLLGEWIFAVAERGRRHTAQEQRYLAELQPWLSDPLLADIEGLTASAAQFVSEAAERLTRGGAAIIGFSTSFQQTCASLAVARRVKELAPETVVCFGGANCEGPMGRALLEAFPFIDHVFSGEADHTFPEFVCRHLAGATRADWHGFKYSRGREAGFVEAQEPAPLDELPIPDFADYFAALARTGFRGRVEPGLLFESSRGCWWGAKRHCRFCGLNGKTMAFRSKSPSRVLDEIERLHARWGIERFAAADNIMDVKQVTSVFEPLADRQPAYRFFYEIKSNMGWRQLHAIARGGVTWVQPGIESLDDEVLALMEKGVTALQNIRLLRSCAELGIGTLWNVLAGFPGETADSYRRMADLMPSLEHLDPPNSCSRIRLDRFSPYFERATELGFKDLRPMPAYGVVYELPDEQLAGLAYFYDGTPVSSPDGDYLGPVRKVVAEWRRRTREEFPTLLLLHQVEGLPLVHDTRSCAVARWRALTMAELAVLEHFRDPVEVKQGLRALTSEEVPEAEARSAFESLAACRFLVLDRGQAVTVVVDTARRVHPPEALAEYPPGRLVSGRP